MSGYLLLLGQITAVIKYWGEIELNHVQRIIIGPQPIIIILDVDRNEICSRCEA